jgi:heme A synthase
MRREGLRFSLRLRRWFYGVFGVLFVSGAAWLAFHQWGAVENEFGPAPNPAGPWLLRLHGAAAMAALVLLGILLPLHVRRAWHARRNRSHGVLMLGLCALLVVTGYALYYAGGEQIRHHAALIHDVLGLALPLFLIWHIVQGRRSRPERRARLPHPPSS